MSSRQKVQADRGQYVAKSNELIRKTRYNLTTQQQKIILYAISKIKPDDDITTEYTININDLAAACGIKLRGGGYYYADLKKDIDFLTHREWCHMPDGLHMTMSWLGDVKIYEKDATIKFWFNPNMKDYLFDLQQRYTMYQLEKVLVFKSKYAIRLYEILRSYISKTDLDEGTFDEKEVTLSLGEFREQFDLQKNYRRWADINRYVLTPAVEEINNRSDELHVEFNPVRGEHKRTIEKIHFLITPAKAKQMLIAHQEKRRYLDGHS